MTNCGALRRDLPLLSLLSVIQYDEYHQAGEAEESYS